MIPANWNVSEFVAAGIDGVQANDVEAVRKSFPEKLAAARAFLGIGRLGRLGDLGRNLCTLFDLLTDRTFSVPWRTTAAAVFALAYFVLSFDLIPDAIPVLGFLDDALVVAEVVVLLSGDIQRFRQHQTARQGSSPTRDEARGASVRLVA